MKSIIFTIFALFFLQFTAKAEISKDEISAAQQKMFVLCALNDGLNKDRLEKEMKLVLRNSGIDPNLVNNKDVIERANFLFSQGSCEAFPRNTYLFDWVKELQNNSSGEKIYYRSNSSEKKVIQSMAIATCKYREGLFTIRERDNFVQDQTNSLPEGDINVNLMQEYISSSIWYAQNILDSKCIKKEK